jgi:transcriptional regulator with XRE-family HTH domain
MRLAELCDSSPGYIGEIECGRRFPSVRMIERIAGALHVESYFLFRNEAVGRAGRPGSRLVPSQKKELLDKMNSTISRLLDDF